MIQATDGNLYGIMDVGGANGGGTIFKITLSGTLTTLYNVCSQSGCPDGQYPAGGLVQATDGNLYGTTDDGGSMRNINSPSLFPSGTEAYGINNAGEVVGTGYLSSSNFHAFLYSGGKMKDIGPAGAFQATAYAINTTGQIVGTYSLNSGASGTFLYTNGKMTVIPNPSDSRGGFGIAINDNGEIVGTLYPSAGGSHAAKFSSGAWTDLGNFTGAQGSGATAIHGAGQIVGTAIFPPIYKPFKPGKHVPFISTASGWSTSIP
jgi:probable HAF family extracellular repeat protein/uncharacterized repeat protein (TIGR03803 family)